MKPQQVRQGDVFLCPAAKPNTLQAVPLDHGRVILAYGEVTGHAHEVAAGPALLLDAPPATLDEPIANTDPEMPASALFTDPSDGQTYLLVNRPSHVRHEEHGAIDLEPGCYRVVRQVEYTPEAVRQVAD